MIWLHTATAIPATFFPKVNPAAAPALLPTAHSHTAPATPQQPPAPREQPTKQPLHRPLLPRKRNRLPPCVRGNYPQAEMPLPAPQLAELYALAQSAAEQAYAPYSGFRVGAALLLENAATITGCNVENSSYGLTICAERNAVFRAVAERGPSMRISAVAVANLNHAPSPPCGACRQVLSEFVTADALVIFPGESGLALAAVAFCELLPHAFHIPEPL